MSRVGRKPIEILDGVEVELEGRAVLVKGGKGELALELPAGISVEQEGRRLVVKRDSDEKKTRALHGTIRSRIANMIEGVSKGFEKNLEIVGVGYRAKVEGRVFVMQLGFSHPSRYEIPAGVSVRVGNDNAITVAGCDKDLVGQVAAKLRSYRPPEPYKGKGIRYRGEWVRRKAGKAMASS